MRIQRCWPSVAQVKYTDIIDSSPMPPFHHRQHTIPLPPMLYEAELEHDDLIVDVLQGRERIVSYPSTSQFNARGISACGLAAMNFASVLLELVHNRGQGRAFDVLRAIVSRETIEVSVSGCGNELSCFSAHHMLSPLTNYYNPGHYLCLFGMVK